MTQGSADQILSCRRDAELLRQIFQKKWRLQVLQELAGGPVRLSELRQRVPDSSKKMLIDTLHGLERLAWIERRELSTRVRKVEYSLATLYADDLIRIVRGLASK